MRSDYGMLAILSIGVVNQSRHSDLPLIIAVCESVRVTSLQKSRRRYNDTVGMHRPKAIGDGEAPLEDRGPQSFNTYWLSSVFQ